MKLKLFSGRVLNSAQLFRMGTKHGLFYLPGLCTISVSILIITSVSSHAQHSFSGYVQDSLTGERLVAVHLYNTLHEIGTVTNSSGFFSFSTPHSSPVIQVTYVGYKSKVILFDSARAAYIVHLVPIVWLDSVEVQALGNRSEITQTRMSTNFIPVEQIQHAPATLGEQDVLKLLQLLPGIQGGNEGQSGLHVRGGSPDQNLILLDGVPLYNVSHLFGFFSSINPDAIKHLEVMKGGFPARYAGRLSSIIDVTLKDGDAKNWKGNASVGLIASKINVEGPIVKDRTTLVFSARRTFLDLFAKSLIKRSLRGEGDVGYFFHDLNLKINHSASSKDRISFSIYHGQDKYNRSDQFTDFSGIKEIEVGLGWENLVSSLRWTREWSAKMFSRSSLTFSHYQYKTKNNSSNFEFESNTESRVRLKYRAGIRDFTWKTDFDFVPGTRHFIRWGFSLTWHRYRPGTFENEITYVPDSLLNFGYDPVSALEAGLYVEDEWKITPALSVNGGLHVSGYHADNTLFTALQPRIVARWLLGDDLALKGSYARMVQYPHLLTNEGVGLPTDLWLPSTGKVRPEHGWQTAVGLAYGPGDLEFSLEGYYREMRNVINFSPGAGLLSSADWEDKIVQGEGKAYGVEFLLQKKAGRLSGWLGYTLSRSDRQFAELNLGRPYPYRYDRRHQIAVTGNYRISNHFRISANWIFRSGNPVTIYELSIKNRTTNWTESDLGRRYPNGIGGGYNTFSSRNNFRLGNYHRIDLELSYRWGKKRNHILSAGLYNAYDRRNPYFIDYFSESITDADGSTLRVTRIGQISLFPVIPSFNFRIDFR